MMLARNVTSRGARGAAILALLLATAAPLCAAAQGPVQKIDPPAATAAQGAATPGPAQGPVGPQPMSESVAAVVNDDIISTYDLGQRMRDGRLAGGHVVRHAGKRAMGLDLLQQHQVAHLQPRRKAGLNDLGGRADG